MKFPPDIHNPSPESLGAQPIAGGSFLSRKSKNLSKRTRDPASPAQTSGIFCFFGKLVNTTLYSVVSICEWTEGTIGER